MKPQTRQSWKQDSDFIFIDSRANHKLYVPEVGQCAYLFWSQNNASLYASLMLPHLSSQLAPVDALLLQFISHFAEQNVRLLVPHRVPRRKRKIKHSTSRCLFHISGGTEETRMWHKGAWFSDRTQQIRLVVGRLFQPPWFYHFF